MQPAGYSRANSGGEKNSVTHTRQIEPVCAHFHKYVPQVGTVANNIFALLCYATCAQQPYMALKAVFGHFRLYMGAHNGTLYEQIVKMRLVSSGQF